MGLLFRCMGAASPCITQGGGEKNNYYLYVSMIPHFPFIPNRVYAICTGSSLLPQCIFIVSYYL